LFHVSSSLGVAYEELVDEGVQADRLFACFFTKRLNCLLVDAEGFSDSLPLGQSTPHNILLRWLVNISLYSSRRKLVRSHKHQISIDLLFGPLGFALMCSSLCLYIQPCGPVFVCLPLPGRPPHGTRLTFLLDNLVILCASMCTSELSGDRYASFRWSSPCKKFMRK